MYRDEGEDEYMAATEDEEKLTRSIWSKSINDVGVNFEIKVIGSEKKGFAEKIKGWFKRDKNERRG